MKLFTAVLFLLLFSCYRHLSSSDMSGPGQVIVKSVSEIIMIIMRPKGIAADAKMRLHLKDVIIFNINWRGYSRSWKVVVGAFLNTTVGTFLKSWFRLISNNRLKCSCSENVHYGQFVCFVDFLFVVLNHVTSSSRDICFITSLPVFLSYTWSLALRERSLCQFFCFVCGFQLIHIV